MQTITLAYPFTLQETKYNSLSLRRPKAKDHLAVEMMGNNEAEKEIALIANLADVSPEVIKELDLADYVKVQQELSDFLQPQPVT